MGAFAAGGLCLLPGGCVPRGGLLPGGVVSQHALRQTPPPCEQNHRHMSVADLHSKILDTRPPPVQILSISCSFWENLAKSYVGAPPPPPPPPPGSWRPLLGEILDPPLHVKHNLAPTSLRAVIIQYLAIYVSRPLRKACQ